MPPQIPTDWLIGILVLLFGGGSGGIWWMIRRDIRESRTQPNIEQEQRLANEHATAELTKALREAQREALSDMRQLLADARAEVGHAREEASRAKAEAQNAGEQAMLAKDEARRAQQEAHTLTERFAAFRMRVEELLRQNNISIPDWWHQPF